MSFTKQYLSKIPIEDNVFKVVKMAKQAIIEHGEKAVVDATIGSLYDEEGNLVAFKSVYDNFNHLDNQTKAAYAQSFAGNQDYLESVNQWIIQKADYQLPYASVASIGGSGAISMSFSVMLESGQGIVAPNIAWGSYSLMAEQFNLKYTTYNLLKDDHFDMESFKSAVNNALIDQDKVLIVINDPCHNPTGLSMGKKVWQEVIAFLNSIDPSKSIVLLNDIAYIDYSYDLKTSRDYLEAINEIDDHILFLVAFSLSKTFTSYGMRTGALFVSHRSAQILNEVMIVLEKSCRSIWSNIPNGSMKNFSSVMANDQEAYIKEKQGYIDLLAKRSALFIKEAKQCDLEHYHYDEGFFITLKMDNQTRDQLHGLLLENHIYTVKVNMGIRIAICSLSIEKTRGLAQRIKRIMTSL